MLVKAAPGVNLLSSIALGALFIASPLSIAPA